jgi:thioredoxin 1
MVSPIVDQIAEEYGEYLVAKVNVDEEGELAAEFGVSSIPMLVVMQNGAIVAQSVGARPKEQILAMLKG